MATVSSTTAIRLLPVWLMLQCGHIYLIAIFWRRKIIVSIALFSCWTITEWTVQVKRELITINISLFQAHVIYFSWYIWRKLRLYKSMKIPVNVRCFISATLCYHCPAGTRRNNNVFTTSTRRRRRRVDVVKTLSLRNYCVMCPLGGVASRTSKLVLIRDLFGRDLTQNHDIILQYPTYRILTSLKQRR